MLRPEVTEASWATSDHVFILVQQLYWNSVRWKKDQGKQWLNCLIYIFQISFKILFHELLTSDKEAVDGVGQEFAPFSHGSGDDGGCGGGKHEVKEEQRILRVAHGRSRPVFITWKVDDEVFWLILNTQVEFLTNHIKLAVLILNAIQMLTKCSIARSLPVWFDRTISGLSSQCSTIQLFTEFSHYLELSFKTLNTASSYINWVKKVNWCFS